MKRFNVLLILCLALLASSCNHRVYNAKLLQGYYDVRMNTRAELEVKGKVRIFNSVSEVTGDYDVISYNTYKPMLFTSFYMPKMFYEKAVKKTYNLGGNGVIITSAGSYTVISLSEWDSDNAESAAEVNAILNTALMDKFNSGEIADLSPREIKRCVTDLDNEIKFNIQTMNTSEEAVVVGRKIQALIDWNYSQVVTDRKLAKALEGYAELHKVIYKRIVRKESKSGLATTVEFEVNTHKGEDDNIEVEQPEQVQTTNCDSIDEVNREIVVVEYKGVKAIVAHVAGKKAFLFAIDEKCGTWNDAVTYCQTLGKEWRLPSSDELKKLKNVLGDYIYWTRMEVSENTAKYYSLKDDSLQDANKARNFYYRPITVVDVAEL